MRYLATMKAFKKRLDEMKVADSEQEILSIDSELANFWLDK